MSEHVFKLIRGTQELDLSDAIKYKVVAFDGFGMPPVRRLTQRSPNQDGDFDVGFRLEPRLVRLIVLGAGANDNALLNIREELLGFLRPNEMVKLRWERPDGSVRQLDTYYTESLTLDSEDFSHKHHRAIFTLRAADPTWYNPSGNTHTVLYEGQSGFTFNLPVPFFFGSSTFKSTVNINLNEPNAWDTFPKIFAFGQMTGLKIENTTLNEILDFGTNSIGAGSVYTIDLAFGAKTVIETPGDINRVGQLTSTSTLATWRLAPGANSVRVSASSAASGARVVIQYNTRFIGV